MLKAGDIVIVEGEQWYIGEVTDLLEDSPWHHDFIMIKPLGGYFKNANGITIRIFKDYVYKYTELHALLYLEKEQYLERLLYEDV